MEDSGWYQEMSSAGTPAGIWRREYADRMFGQVEHFQEMVLDENRVWNWVERPTYYWFLSYGHTHPFGVGEAPTLEAAMQKVDDSHEELIRRNTIIRPDLGHGHQATLRIESYRRPR